jgi:hypothetical protein
MYPIPLLILKNNSVCLLYSRKNSIFDGYIEGLGKHIGYAIHFPIKPAEDQNMIKKKERKIKWMKENMKKEISHTLIKLVICDLCKKNTLLINALTIADCNHIFCKKCLSKYFALHFLVNLNRALNDEFEKQRFQVLCPFPGCQQFLLNIVSPDLKGLMQKEKINKSQELMRLKITEKGPIEELLSELEVNKRLKIDEINLFR